MKRSGRATKSAVSSERWMATSLGTSSPKSTCPNVRMVKAITTSTTCDTSPGSVAADAQPKPGEHVADRRLADPAEAGQAAPG